MWVPMSQFMLGVYSVILVFIGVQIVRMAWIAGQPPQRPPTVEDFLEAAKPSPDTHRWIIHSKDEKGGLILYCPACKEKSYAAASPDGLKWRDPHHPLGNV
jgi:hypothetical protein